MRHALIAFVALLLAACAAPPRPFEHGVGTRYPVAGNHTVEITIAPPARMPDELGMRVAHALAVELQSYGVLAVVQPSDAPMKLGGVTTTADIQQGMEIEVAWYIERNGRTEGPAVSKTRAQQQDYDDASDRLVSRIAQQAAPRIATLMGRAPTFTPSSPGQVAAGVSVLPPGRTNESGAIVPAAAGPGVGPGGATTLPGQKPSGTPLPPSQPPQQTQVKMMVAPVTGAPSDGNRQLFSGMRRALGSHKIVVIDRAGADTFTVAGKVDLTQVDERFGRLVIKWVLRDPSGKDVGELEQVNNVPMASARGSWAGFGDVIGMAAVEGILELLEKALNRAR
jgi:uncharacterized lipoprotein YmbA